MIAIEYTVLGISRKLFASFANLFSHPTSIGLWFSEYVYPKLPIKDRLAFQKKAMSGQEGEGWADHYRSEISEYPPARGVLKLGLLDFYEALPFFDVLLGLLSSKRYKRCIQLGCSSGREVAYFASQFPDITFIGTEIDAHLVSLLKHYHQDKENLDFLVSWVMETPSLIDLNDTLIFSNGTLQYVYPEHIAEFYQQLPTVRNMTLVVSEPTNFKRGDPRQLQGSRVRGKLSYTHNYGFYAQQFGLSVDQEQLTKPYTEEKKVANYLGVYRSIDQ